MEQDWTGHFGLHSRGRWLLLLLLLLEVWDGRFLGNNSGGSGGGQGVSGDGGGGGDTHGVVEGVSGVGGGGGVGGHGGVGHGVHGRGVGGHHGLGGVGLHGGVVDVGGLNNLDRGTVTNNIVWSDWRTLELETMVKRRFAKVSIVSYS